uniref:Uncharacterized protein n=1 Tax=Lotus japonicus TaxID=34305 RepID=I3SBQ7_LOTJA|nr:unknown [Lotus japonicus]
MACLDMYNSERKQGHHHPMSPRISFSNDFVDVQQALKQERNSRSDTSLPVVSSDFEFSTTNYSMMSADELFSKGRLLPYKDSCNNHNQMQRATTTLKEELLNNDDEYNFSRRPPKGRWKGLLGLKKYHIGSKKVERSEGSSDRGAETRRLASPHNITSQEMLNEGSSICRDLELGL